MEIITKCFIYDNQDICNKNIDFGDGFDCLPILTNIDIFENFIKNNNINKSNYKWIFKILMNEIYIFEEKDFDKWKKIITI